MGAKKWKVKRLEGDAGYAVIDDAGLEIMRGVLRPEVRKLFSEICGNHNRALSSQERREP